MPHRYLPIVILLTTLLSAAASWFLFEPFDETAGWPIERVALSPSGRWIAAAAASGWIGIIDQQQPDSPQRFRGGTGPLRDLRFTNDEQWLVVRRHASTRHSVQTLGSLEDLAPGDDPGVPQMEAAWPGDHTSNVVSGHGVIVFGNAAGSIEVHDAHSGALLRRFMFR